MRLWAAGKATALENCARQAAQGRCCRGAVGIVERGADGSAGWGESGQITLGMAGGQRWRAARAP